MSEVARMKNFKTSGNVDGRASGLFLHATPDGSHFPFKFRCSKSLQNRDSYKTSLPAGTCEYQVQLQKLGLTDQPQIPRLCH
jgi:hypothetical protein